MMDNAEVLRGTLALYDWTDNEMNRRRLEAIAEVIVIPECHCTDHRILLPFLSYYHDTLT